MSATLEATVPQRKKFQGGERLVPHHSQKASKYYPAYDEKRPKKVRKSARPCKLRKELVPGCVLILLSGRFAGKRVVFLKHLEEGILLVSGPLKINGVPLRRVNHRYVIACSTKVNIHGLDKGVMDKISDKAYWARPKKSRRNKDEEQFFKQGKEKTEKKEVSKDRIDHQKSIDKTLLSAIKKEPMLASYLASTFSLKKGDKFHEMKF